MGVYRFLGVPAPIAAAVRTNLRSPQYGHPAHVEVASGYGPCRSCLATFEAGAEDRILFTYQPFSEPGALPAPGPVFIHREPCERREGREFPERLRSVPLVVEGFGGEGRLIAQARVGDRVVEEVVDEVMRTPEVRFGHLRNAEAGCFVARIDRA